MKFLLLLLSIIFLSCSINDSGRAVPHTPFMKRIASMMSDYWAEKFDPFLTEKEEDSADVWDRLALSCIYVYCHFEDRNACKKECEKFAKQWNPATEISKIVRARTPYFEDCNLLEINTEKSCVNDCVNFSFKTDQSGKICSALCATLFSYSEKEREQYRKESKIYCFYMPEYFWLPWV